MKHWIRIAALASLVIAGQAHAGDRPTKERVDLFDKKSNRQGYVIIDNSTGRIDIYDRKSNRTGYGLTRDHRTWSTYSTDSKRTGSAVRR